MRAPIELRPSSNPVAAREMLIGKPTQVAKVVTDPTSNAVMTVTKILSLIEAALARSLKRFVSLPRTATSPHKKASSSPIFL